MGVTVIAGVVGMAGDQVVPLAVVVRELLQRLKEICIAVMASLLSSLLSESTSPAQNAALLSDVARDHYK